MVALQPGSFLRFLPCCKHFRMCIRPVLRSPCNKGALSVLPTLLFRRVNSGQASGSAKRQTLRNGPVARGLIKQGSTAFGDPRSASMCVSAKKGFFRCKMLLKSFRLTGDLGEVTRKQYYFGDTVAEIFNVGVFVSLGRKRVRNML